tara:strand:- start:1611 stop:1892 length:282 start_codon:yes stop_codon:yes gene_type:complete
LVKRSARHWGAQDIGSCVWAGHKEHVAWPEPKAKLACLLLRPCDAVSGRQYPLRCNQNGAAEMAYVHAVARSHGHCTNGFEAPFNISIDNGLM